ncbi:MAG: aminopeptidase P family protein [Saprospiraceae bacterium]
MFSASTYQSRREKLKKSVGSGLLLFLGNNDVGMNYSGNTYHFRQDSNFLYFFGIDKPGLAAVIDIDNDKEIIFGDDLSMEDIVWMGAMPKMKELGAQVGIHEILQSRRLNGYVKKARRAGATIHYLPPYRHDNQLLLKKLLNINPDQQKAGASEAFIRGIVAQRSYKSAEEIQEMEHAVNVTGAMHIAAMREAREGKVEAELAGLVEGLAVANGGNLSYPVILSVNGQILHNHYHGNTMENGQLVLGDFGAETAMHYAGDITRTFPVSSKFTTKQKEIYQLVLNAEVNAIKACKPGVTYQSIHLNAALEMAEGLKALGIMKGDMKEAVALGAHALFFPHGLGHMIGLDVHDMEDLGENFVGYDNQTHRSDLFGTAYLRLGRKLEPGFVLTVEPGLYFIPELINMWRRQKKFEQFINYESLKKYRKFGGIRIEDNVLITENGHRILGEPIPKTIQEVEDLREGM